MIAYWFQLRTYAALKVYLAALLLVTVLASGLVGERVAPVWSTEFWHTQPRAGVECLAVKPRAFLGLRRTGESSWRANAARRCVAHGRPHRGEARAAGQAPSQAQVATLPLGYRRSFARQTGGGGEPDEDAPAPAPRRAYASRAPPTLVQFA